jgi:hypothetical protein
MSPLEYAFIMHEETKFMLRVPAIVIGVERELLPYTSAMTQAIWGAGRIQLYAELRWYNGSKRLGVLNMSGNYVAGGYFHNGFNSDMFYARWGMQRRFLGNGLIDLGFLAGYRKTEIFHPFTSKGYLNLETNSSLGLSLVFNQNKNIDRNRVCPMVKCFEVDRFMLKFNLPEIIGIHYFPAQSQCFGRFQTSIALEHKLFNSSISPNVNWEVFLFAGNSPNENSKFYRNRPIYSGAEFIGEGRWYYDMHRRIRNGKGGNGLSANYIATGVRQQYGELYGDNKAFQPGYIFTTGVQCTIGKRIYFDVQCGIAENLNERFGYPI